MGKVLKAVELAEKAHAGQMDKDGLPHLAHVKRVAASELLSTERQMIIATLHDVVEDSGDEYIDEIRKEFGIDIMWAVLVLTRMVRDGQSYSMYIHGVLASMDHDLILVKMADLADNIARTQMAVETTFKLRKQREYGDAVQRFATEGYDVLLRIPNATRRIEHDYAIKAKSEGKVEIVDLPFPIVEAELVARIKEWEALKVEMIEVLKPFSHRDLSKVCTGNVQGDNSPVFQRDKAMLRLGDFQRVRNLLYRLGELDEE